MPNVLRVWLVLALSCLAAGQPLEQAGAGAAADSAAGAAQVTLDTLLEEMRDRSRLAFWPDLAYRTGQFSSYDRASTTPDEPVTWFANADTGHYLRVEQRAGRTEHVMMEADGPGAVVRIWSANPRGVLRVYIDHQPEPVIEAPMADVLGGRWKPGAFAIGEPFAGVRARGYSLFLPLPYARHCRITSDQGGFYYLINHRTYAPGTAVKSFDLADVRHHPERFLAAAWSADPAPADDASELKLADRTLASGERITLHLPAGPGGVHRLRARVRGEDLEAALRSTVLEGTFDGEDAIWCPVGDFFGSGVGLNPFRDHFREVHADGWLTSHWLMPYLTTASLAIVNHGTASVRVDLEVLAGKIQQHVQGDPADRLMHFHATWRHQYPLPTRPFKDWNYVEVQGRGVYIGDTLAVMNPVTDWWGEGDEKIYVDGEPFPSHFGTGTEDYYGYAWCSPQPFTHMFHAQPRSDGFEHENNWGHTTNSRVRSLDAIPFEKSLKMDMEVWHWKECEVAYAATTYFYARPGTTTNRHPSPKEASLPIHQPPPLPPRFRIDGALECERLQIIARSEGLEAVRQDMRGFAPGVWSNEQHLWVRGGQPGDFVELAIPGGSPDICEITLYATRSWDYGVIQFSVNGEPAGDPVDLASGERGIVRQTGPIDLGRHRPVDGRFRLRAEVTGTGPRSLAPGTYFGLDAVVLRPAP